MMERVNKIKLNEDGVPKGTTVAIVDVSPETIPVGESLPSIEMADAATKMLTPSHVTDWKEEFINKFGEEGQLVKGLTLDWNWDVTGNDAYISWKNSGIQSKSHDLKQYNNKGWSID